MLNERYMAATTTADTAIKCDRSLSTPQHTQWLSLDCITAAMIYNLLHRVSLCTRANLERWQRTTRTQKCMENEELKNHYDLSSAEKKQWVSFSFAIVLTPEFKCYNEEPATTTKKMNC